MTLRSNALRLGLAALALPGVASAHAILTGSTPAPGGTLAAGHRTLDFRYNSKIDHRRSRLTLTAPDGSHAVLPILPASAVNAMDAEADLVPGGLHGALAGAGARRPHHPWRRAVHGHGQIGPPCRVAARRTCSATSASCCTG